MVTTTVIIHMRKSNPMLRKCLTNMAGKLPKTWLNVVLQPSLNEIKRLIKLETASFSGGMNKMVPYPTNEKEVDAFVKDRIRVWLTNISMQVESIEETL